jgi:hypothetical protein
LTRRHLLLAFTLLAAAHSIGCGATTPPVTYSIMPSALGPIEAERNRAKDFGRVFCSTLPHLKDGDGRSWGDCAKYMEFADAPQPQAEIPARYQFLLVPGFGGECLRNVRAFSTSIAHLKDAHHVDIEYFAVAPFASSEENGKSIARRIDGAWSADSSRRFIVIGYGKGTADILDALRVIDDVKTKVAAVVSVAGIVGGTWVPEDVQALMQPQRPWITEGCPGNVQDGAGSLMREVRQSFLRQNPMPVPSYSIVGATSLDETSSVLKPSWKRLSVHAREQDGLMIAWEAVLPGARYLGSARADHWAIALPFEESEHTPKGIDRNHFPRDALLEAIVRYVTADIQPQ